VKFVELVNNARENSQKLRLKKIKIREDAQKQNANVNPDVNPNRYLVVDQPVLHTFME